MKPITIDAKGMHYTELNRRIRQAVAAGASEVTIDHVLGQRFIADGLKGDVRITINGVPGGDLGMFMSGPVCTIYGNAEHAPGNTMDGGAIIIHGCAGDAVAHSMRGGRVYVRDSIGYRGGIHMKEYQGKRPILVVGGSARAFLGEDMAGGLIVVLGCIDEETVAERGIGSGIHGGEIFIRGSVDDRCLGVGATKRRANEEDRQRIAPIIKDFAGAVCLDYPTLIEGEFVRIGPAGNRPFANKYVWER